MVPPPYSRGRRFDRLSDPTSPSLRSLPVPELVEGPADYAFAASASASWDAAPAFLK